MRMIENCGLEVFDNNPLEQICNPFALIFYMCDYCAVITP
jgi:hypothetical protein